MIRFYDGVADDLHIMATDFHRRAHVLHVLGYEGIRCSPLRKSADALYQASAFLGADDLVYDVGPVHDLNALGDVEAVADGYLDRWGDFVPRSELVKTDGLRNWLAQHRQPSHDVEAVRQAVGHMLGSTTSALRAAARLLAPPGQHPVEIDGAQDAVEAALLTWGLEVTPARRQAVIELAGGLAKSEDFRPALVPLDVEPLSPGSLEAAAAIRRAEARGLIYEAQLGGKHSSGAAVAMDPASDALWMLKPGSGPLSPGAGIADVPTSQARREVASAQVGRALMPANFPETHLLSMGGHEVAAIRVVPRDAVPAQKLTLDARAVFGSHVVDASLFQWAALDWVLGNVDRHSGNILVAPGHGVYLIDHGSTLAGTHFDPAHDGKSFVPYYLRAWAPDWVKMSPDRRRSALPDAGPSTHGVFRHWIQRVFTADRLEPVQRLAPDAYAAVRTRLHDLQAAVDPLSTLLDYWSGVRAPASVQS